jgi:3-oxoacyl-[acyl-carrier-protein] synthase-3
VTLGIEAIAHVLGANRVDNAQFGRQHGFEPEFITDKLGIETRYTAAVDEAVSDLACAAVAALLERTGVAKEEIGFLAVVTQTPDYQLPHTAALVQSRLGLSQRLASFDLSLGCSGFVYGLATATAFMQAQGIRRGILVTADVYSRLIQAGDRATSPLFSDAAAATLIGEQPIYTLGRTLFGTDGTGAASLMVKSGGSREPGGEARLFMDGRAVYTFMMTCIPRDVRECLALNGLQDGDVDRYVFHQANRFMLESLADRMRLDRAKVVIAVRDGGNTVGSTIPIALEPLLAQRHRHILISGFGVGLSWATGILNLNETFTHE